MIMKMIMLNDTSFLGKCLFDLPFIVNQCIVFFVIMFNQTMPLVGQGTDTASQVNVSLIDQSGVAYGGILNDLSATVKPSDPDVITVIDFASEYVVETIPTAVHKDESGKINKPTISGLKKLKLQATRDAKHPHYLVDSQLVAGRIQHHRRQVIFGVTYAFSLTWSQLPNHDQHNFVVSLDRDRHPLMIEHTFHTPQLPLACRSGDSEAVDGQLVCEASGTSAFHFSGEADVITSLHDVETTKRQSVNIATYNIWNFNGVGDDTNEAYIDRITRLGELVESVRPDIIGFQEVRIEVDKGGRIGSNQVKHLASHMPKYQFVYQPAVAFVFDSLVRREEGLAIFSLYPIIAHDFILLSRDLNDDDDKVNQRICLHAEIKTPHHGTIHVFVTHLSLSEAARQRSVVEIWEHMAKFPGPALLMGDLNDLPQGKSIRFLRGEVELNGIRTHGLHDAWLLKNGEPRTGRNIYAPNEKRDPGLTFSTLNDHLSKRIDFIFLRLPDDLHLTDISLVDDGGRGPVAASDHLGLVASISGCMKPELPQNPVESNKKGL